MPLEDGTTISALDRSFPLPDDIINQGDDHLRLIKKVLKAQFPGENGQGFDTPITATEEEINNLEGLNFNIVDGFTFIGSVFGQSLMAPAGTILLFANATVPNGWVQVLSDNNSMLRHVTGTAQGGNSGGEDDPTLYEGEHSHETRDHSITNNELPSHSHAMFTGRADNNAPGPGVFKYTASWWDNGDSGQNYTMKQSAGGTPTLGAVSLTGKGDGHNHGYVVTSGKNWKPRYLNVIKGRKKPSTVEP